MVGREGSEFSSEVKQYLENVVHETPKNRSDALDELKRWSGLNSHLHARTDDKFLIIFLRGCKYNIEKTKEKLANFYKMRRDVPGWFANRNTHLSEVQELVKMGAFTVLKNTFENKLVMIARPTIPDPTIYDIDTILKVGTMITDISVMEEEMAQIYGIYAIIDLQGTNFRHVGQYTLKRVKNIVNSWHNYHCKPKKIFIINAPIFIHVVLNIFKTFMSKKLKDRMQVSYEGNTALINSIDISILPKEYGGDMETISELGQYWLEKLNSYHEWFLDDEKYKAE